MNCPIYSNEIIRDLIGKDFKGTITDVWDSFNT